VGIEHLLLAASFIVVAGCSSNGSGASSSSSAVATAESAPSGTTRAVVTATSTPPAPAAPGSVAELRAKAKGVMDALKKGDAKAAADFCLGKHRDGLEKFIADDLAHPDHGRAKVFAAWSGKLGEIRVEDKLARVAVGDEDGGERVVYLSFRKKDEGWSLDDLPVMQKSAWPNWGKAAE
jgi:hypothetical protein